MKDTSQEVIPPIEWLRNPDGNPKRGAGPSTQMAGRRRKFLVYFVQHEDPDKVLRTRTKPLGQVHYELCAGKRGLWYRCCNGVRLDNPIHVGCWDDSVSGGAPAGTLLAVGVDMREISDEVFLREDVFGREVFYER